MQVFFLLNPILLAPKEKNEEMKFIYAMVLTYFIIISFRISFPLGFGGYEYSFGQRNLIPIIPLLMLKTKINKIYYSLLGLSLVFSLYGVIFRWFTFELILPPWRIFIILFLILLSFLYIKSESN